MLRIWLNDWSNEARAKEYEGHVSAYFDEVYEKEWFRDDFVARVIKEVDDTEVISGEILRNGVLGDIPPHYLSSGCKALILLYKEGIKINGDRLGDNCVPLLLEMSEVKDIEISLTHIMKFPQKFKALIENTGSIVSTPREFLFAYGDELL